MPYRTFPPLLGALWICACLLGCRATQIHDPQYVQLLDSVSQSWTAAEPVLQARAPVVPELAGPQPVETYIAYALAQNPEIQAARMQVEAQANRVPQAASLEDPMLEVNPFLEPMLMGDMQQDFQLGVSQQLPWHGKLDLRAEIAEEEVQVARAELAAKELEIIERVKFAYYELYFIQQAIEITQQQRDALTLIEQLAETRYRVEEVAQADWLRAQLELLNLDNELIRLQQQLESGQARLARLLRLSPDTPLRALHELPPETIPRDLERLYNQAIAARPELHAQLSGVMRDRRSVDLARLDYYPDVRLSGMWMGMSMADGGPRQPGMNDAFMLGVSVNLPIYRKRLDAGVREAEARAVSSARQYDALRDRTQEEVRDLFAQIQSQYELVTLFGESIIPRSELTFDVSLRAYEVEEVTFLELLENWLSLLRYEVEYERLQAQLRQSLAALEQLLGGTVQQLELPLAVERETPLEELPQGPREPPPVPR